MIEFCGRQCFLCTLAQNYIPVKGKTGRKFMPPTQEKECLCLASSHRRDKILLKTMELQSQNMCQSSVVGRKGPIMTAKL